jgi:hypothetical protein
MASKLNPNLSKKETSCDWKVRRDDDTPDIVEERLRVYHRNADPILNYIRDNNNNNTVGKSDSSSSKHYRLLTLTPYRGFEDLPGLVEKLHRHVNA